MGDVGKAGGCKTGLGQGLTTVKLQGEFQHGAS